MKINELIKSELSGFSRVEKIVSVLILFFTVLISFLTHDSKVALVSSVCGMSYVILSGKGKVSSFYIGLMGTLCYCYIAFKNAFYGNLCLYGLYYLPMQTIGIFFWKKNLKEDENEIVKAKLTVRKRILYLIFGLIFTIILSFILRYFGGKTPYIDSFTTVFSILGLFLTVKRCFEQWFVWLFVNIFSLFMWLNAYLQTSQYLATVIMWTIYVFLAVYFLYTWKKELK